MVNLQIKRKINVDVLDNRISQNSQNNYTFLQDNKTIQGILMYITNT